MGQGCDESHPNRCMQRTLNHLSLKSKPKAFD